MRSKEFRALVVERTRTYLPDEWRGFQHRARFSLVQLWYDDPAFHFEVWPQRRYEVLEIGLHLEHRSSARNAALHALFDAHFVEIRHALGEVWLERWDRGWHKLYKTVALAPYSEKLAEQAARELAQQIPVLQPLLRVGLRSLPRPTNDRNP